MTIGHPQGVAVIATTVVKVIGVIGHLLHRARHRHGLLLCMSHLKQVNYSGDNNDDENNNNNIDNHDNNNNDNNRNNNNDNNNNDDTDDN